MRSKLEKIVRELYQDIFDSGNCSAVDKHYHKDVVCFFNGLTLNLQDLKASMAKFVSLHEEIKTEIRDLLIDGNSTFARLERYATCKITKQKKQINIMVFKKFVDDKISQLWFMVDSDIYQKIWSEKNSSSLESCSSV